MNYQIEKWPAFKVSGIKKIVQYDKAFKIIPQIWQEAQSNGTMKKLFELVAQADMRPAGLLGICITSNDSTDEDMEYYLGVTTNVNVPGCKEVGTPANMESLDIPEATWAIFEANGKLPEAVQSVHKSFYTEWLPNSNYEPADLPIIECYMQNDRHEVWIPIKNAGSLDE